MLQHLADLGEAATAFDRRHEPRERGCVAHPAARLAFVEAPEKDELYVEAADRLHRVEHLGLNLQRHVPGWLAAHGGVHGEDQAAIPRVARDGAERTCARKASISARLDSCGAISCAASFVDGGLGGCGMANPGLIRLYMVGLSRLRMRARPRGAVKKQVDFLVEHDWPEMA